MESATLVRGSVGTGNSAASELRRFRQRPRPLPDLRRWRRRSTAAIRAAAEGAEPDLRVRVNGLEMPNPFVIGSGPPGTNYTVMKRAFDEGWGAVIAKTVRSLSLSPPPSPRPLSSCLLD